MGNIIHFSYDYFELEGIPPYTSPFIPVDFTYDWWIDMGDTRNFRFEKHFTTRISHVKSGLMTITTSKNTDSKMFHTEFWEKQPAVSEKEGCCRSERSIYGTAFGDYI